MTDVSLSFEVIIDAPVHTVFEHCLDPRSVYADDPVYRVSEATVVPEGVGTRAHVATKGVFSEDVTLEYVDLTPDQRIVFEGRPRMTVAGSERFSISGSLHTFTWTFAPESGGTRLRLDVVEHDAPRWERALDLLTVKAGTKMFRKQIQGRLDRIKAATERRAASAY